MSGRLPLAFKKLKSSRQFSGFEAMNVTMLSLGLANISTTQHLSILTQTHNQNKVTNILRMLYR